MGDQSGYKLLIDKLDAFIRKYYKNQLVKGLIYGLGIALGFFILTNLIEYFGEFGTSGRTVLFWLFILSTGFVLVRYICMPLFKLGKLGKTISHQQAAEIVGNHFTDVKDKLINTLQLKQMSASNMNDAQFALVNASINQRINELKPVPFTSAIDIAENRKHLWWLLLPILIILGVLIVKSDIITSSTDRLINHNTVIEKVAPFKFVVANNNLEVIENEDFELEVKLEGSYVPDKVYIEHDGKKTKLEKQDNITFKHTFRNVKNSAPFVLFAEEFNSKEYELTAIPNPTINNFNVFLNYPNYTNKMDEELNNIGDVVIPEGTTVRWVFKTRNTKEVVFKFSDSIEDSKLIETLEGQFELERAFYNNTSYSVKNSNQFITSKDSLNHFLSVVKDEYPSIILEEKTDSANTKLKYFTGAISDDYGFSSLYFIYRIKNDELEERDGINDKVAIDINKAFNKDQYYHYWDLAELDLKQGDRVEYYFQVWDNDGVNGPKSARTRTQLYSAPTKEELFENVDQAGEEIKDNLEKSIKEANDLQKELENIQKDLFEKKNLDWQDKNRLEDFLDRQKSLEERIENIQQTNEQINDQKEEFGEMNEELLEKQKMLEELFDKLMDEEMKELYEELAKMMEELNKDKIQEKLEEINWNQEDIEKELDRSLELFRQFEVEQKSEEIAKKLEDLAKKQEELAEKTKEKSESAEDLQKEQEELNKEFDELQEEMKKLDEMNEELEDKKDFEKTKEDLENIDQSMDESSEELKNNKEKKASEKQQSASDQMKDAAQKLRDMMAQQQQESYQEDMQALRMLLENLITFSFDQETIMDDFKGLNIKDPKYVDLGREQRKLKDDAKIIEDSLMALSKRVLPLATTINNEVADMKRGVDKSIYYIKERRTSNVREQQRHTMTATNNLALLLDEMLQQMQNQMKSKQPGSGSCSNPGGQGKPSSSGGGKPSLSQMRQQMQKQLEKMKKSMEKGNKPGGQKPGDKPGNKPGMGGQGGMGFPGSSEELAKMAAEQAAIRREIQRLSQMMNEDGSGNGNGLKEIAKELEKLEEDMVNKRFETDFLKRQQNIVSRLLEHEKAEKEQDLDKKRKADQAKSKKISNPKGFLEYKRKKEQEIELLKTVPADLKQYYKNKVNEYFNNVN